MPGEEGCRLDYMDPYQQQHWFASFHYYAKPYLVQVDEDEDGSMHVIQPQTSKRLLDVLTPFYEQCAGEEWRVQITFRSMDFGFGARVTCGLTLEDKPDTSMSALVDNRVIVHELNGKLPIQPKTKTRQKTPDAPALADRADIVFALEDCDVSMEDMCADDLTASMVVDDDLAAHGEACVLETALSTVNKDKCVPRAIASVTTASSDPLPEDDVADMPIAESLASVGLFGDDALPSAPATPIGDEAAMAGDVELLRTLLYEAQASCDILRDFCRCGDADTVLEGLEGNNRLLTLVLYKPHADSPHMVLEYMQWRMNRMGLQGQSIFTDEENRLNYSVHYCYPFRNRAEYRDLRIISCDLGAKVDKTFRTEVPSNVIRLFRIWDTCKRNKSGLRATVSLCWVCGSGPFADYQCALCLHAFHTTCCARLANHFVESTMKLTASKLPDDFLDERIYCNVCREFAINVASGLPVE